MSESKVRADGGRALWQTGPCVFFVPFGSEGDVNPLLWLVEGMAARGHLPHAPCDHAGSWISRRRRKVCPGHPLGPNGNSFASFGILISGIRRVDLRTVIQGMLETLPAYGEAFAKAGSQFDLVVLSSLALGAASVAEAVGIPRSTLHAAGPVPQHLRMPSSSWKSLMVGAIATVG